LRDFAQDFPDSDTRTRLGIAQALARRAGQTRKLGRTGHGKGAARAKLDTAETTMARRTAIAAGNLERFLEE
jgi:hypothetical protein